MDRKALVGLLSGVSLVIATLIAVAFLNMPETAKASGFAACPAGRHAVDRSYGVATAEEHCVAER